MYYCFGCKAGGTVIQFVMEAEHMDFGEAVRYLADKVHMPLPKQVDAAREAQERSRRETILALNRKAALWFHERLYAPEGARALAYLHGRGLDDAAILQDEYAVAVHDGGQAMGYDDGRTALCDASERLLDQ